MQTPGPSPGAGSLESWQRPEDLPACRELVLVIPAPLLSWHTVALPKIAAGRWRAALDGLLEDRLLQDPAQVHLALAPGAQGGQEVLVAACDKAWLRSTLQALGAAGRHVSRLVPEFEPGPARCHMLGQPERAWLVDGRPDGVHVLALPHPARGTLQAWQTIQGASRPTVSAEPAVAGLAEDCWGQAPQMLTASQSLQQAASSRWNLAQFDLTLQSPWHARLARAWNAAWTAPQWRPARWGLLALLLLQLAGLQAWAWQERRHLQARQEQLKTVLTRTFPQVQVVIDPLLQMERETQALAQAKGQASAADLTRMLGALAALSAPVPTALEFSPGELVLIGWQPAPASLPTWQASLQGQGLRLEPRGDRWRLRLAAPGATP